MNRIVCSPYYSPNGTTKYIEINLRSEFKLIYHFIDPRFNPTKPIPFNRIDFNLKYYIDGREETYIAKKSGELSQNCVLNNRMSTAKVIFENHGLKPGILMCEFTVYTYDTDMADRSLTISETVETGLKLIE